MTKSRRTILKLTVIVLGLLMLATILVACNKGSGPAYYDYMVTFDYNKGNLTGNTPTQYLGVFKNSLVSIRPGYSSDFLEGVIDGYYIEGWYIAKETSEDGAPIKDENGFVILGDKWDFKNDRVNEHTTLYANFKKKMGIQFVDRATGEFVTGDSGRMEGIPGNKLYQPSGSSAPSKTGYTFLGKYYTSVEGDKKFDWPYTITEQDINVYVDFIKGEWRFVDNEEDFVRAIQANKNIYMRGNIDFSKYIENRLWSLAAYTGELNGNGYTISGVKRNLTASRLHDNDDKDPQKDKKFGGIFGLLGETAYIHDVKFENIEVTFKVNLSFKQVDAYVGLIAGSAESGARMKNVTVSGKLSYLPNENHPITANALIGYNKTNIKDIIDCDYSNVVVSQIV